MSHEASPNVDRGLIAAKLSKLREYQAFLRELRRATFEDFIGDFKVRGPSRGTSTSPSNAS